MYAVITEADGTLELSTQVPPESLTPQQAGALLAALEPLLDRLRKRASLAQEVRARPHGPHIVAAAVPRPENRRPAISRARPESSASRRAR